MSAAPPPVERKQPPPVKRKWPPPVEREWPPPVVEIATNLKPGAHKKLQKTQIVRIRITYFFIIREYK